MPDHTTPAPATPPAAEGAPDAPTSRRYVENKPPRGLYVRVFIYVVATHALLAFMSVLVLVAKSRP
ncbi:MULTISPECIES: DUF6126 family protein [unclassified Streptomyces]|uniref:DUF6126 family protein n=1 Tax=unclassified Streptomyces TaxID=2593676 RepID=UPI000C273869|nr:DUF6126 family protein [Streptomyces sp. CB02959]PJN37818.1 hypothetical protein CG747_25275 [Streptomyces sp. CB02959]